MRKRVERIADAAWAQAANLVGRNRSDSGTPGCTRWSCVANNSTGCVDELSSGVLTLGLSNAVNLTAGMDGGCRSSDQSVWDR